MLIKRPLVTNCRREIILTYCLLGNLSEIWIGCFQVNFSDWWLRYLLWNCPLVNCNWTLQIISHHYCLRSPSHYIKQVSCHHTLSLGFYELTDLRWEPHICISELSMHRFRWWIPACSGPSHYLNQCWLIVNWTLMNKRQWNLNQNKQFFHSWTCIWKCHLWNGGYFVQVEKS